MFNSKIQILSYILSFIKLLKNEGTHNYFTCVSYNSALNKAHTTADENCHYPNKCYHYINATSGETRKGKNKWIVIVYSEPYIYVK